MGKEEVVEVQEGSQEYKRHEIYIKKINILLMSCCQNKVKHSFVNTSES